MYQWLPAISPCGSLRSDCLKKSFVVGSGANVDHGVRHLRTCISRGDSQSIAGVRISIKLSCRVHVHDDVELYATEEAYSAIALKSEAYEGRYSGIARTSFGITHFLYR